jgi:FemAB-related protein (PEP-CTERM system-associated)
MSATDVRVRAAVSGDDAARDALVLAHPRGTFFHLTSWRAAVHAIFGHTPQEFVAERGGAIVGVLPLMRTPTLSGRQNLLSMPYAVYGGPLALDLAAEQALLEAAVECANHERVGHLELRYRDDPGPDLAGSSLYWTFRRALPAKVEDVLARMPKKARAEARKARDKHALELSTGRWYVDDLQRMFMANKQKLGSPGMPRHYFARLLEQLGDAAEVHLVRRGNEPLSAVMTFRFRDELCAYYSGTRDGADREWSASNFMYLALQEWAVARGVRMFDFGRSRRDSGAFAFKEHQGFTPAPLHYRYHLVRDRRLPSFNPSNPKTRVLRDAWSRLPAPLAGVLSAPLARYLP